MKAFFSQILCPFWQNRVCAAAVLLLVIAGTSCNSGGESGPDVSGVKITLNTRRLDQDLAKVDTNQMAAGLQQLQAKYPDFLGFYLDTLMGFNIHGNYNDTAAGVRTNLRTFLSHKDYRGLFDTVAKHFPDTKSIDADLTKGFQHMKYYNPQYHVPKVIYFTTGLNNWSAITYGDDIVGVGLDMCLGPGYPYYKSVGIPDYTARNLTPESIPVNVFRSIYSERHPFITESRNLLDMMVQRGKEQYFLGKILPFVADSVRFGFTAAQMQWCAEHEADIYNFFVKGNMLYETNWQKILRYVNDGPEATGMPAESPGNVGSFLGWKIVQAFMKQHPDMKLDDVLRMDDAQQMLQEAKYKPR